MAKARLFQLINQARQNLMYRLSALSSAELDVTVSQLTALFALQRKTLTSGDLAEQLHLNPGATTRTVDRLAAKGLVLRAKDPEDARRRIVTLTDRGRERMKLGFTRLQDANSVLIRGFSREEIAIVVRFLKHVAAIELDSELASERKK